MANAIATLAEVSGIIGTIAKFFRVLNKAGVSWEKFRLVIDDRKARRNLAEFIKRACPDLNTTTVSHIIDCDADPFVPDGWRVEQHIKGGQLAFDPTKIALYLSESQKNGFLTGHQLREELKGKPVLNACVLDWLLVHQELIPDEWKTQRRYFWGTIYRLSDGGLFVRCLLWDGDGWLWVIGWLDGAWVACNPAAVLASN